MQLTKTKNSIYEHANTGIVAKNIYTLTQTASMKSWLNHGVILANIPRWGQKTVWTFDYSTLTWRRAPHLHLIPSACTYSDAHEEANAKQKQKILGRHSHSFYISTLFVTNKPRHFKKNIYLYTNIHTIYEQKSKVEIWDMSARCWFQVTLVYYCLRVC